MGELNSLRSLRAHSFSPKPFKSDDGRNRLSLKWYLTFFPPLGLVCNTIPIYPEESSLSILCHVPYCCTRSRGNWSFPIQQSPDNSNTASVEHAGGTAGHSHSSTQTGLTYFSTKTQAPEERPSSLKRAWESTNGGLCQFSEAKKTYWKRWAFTLSWHRDPSAQR